VLTALLATLLLGALVPCLDMYGAALCRGPTEGKLVALTFDDGPLQTSTPAVLDTLKARGARATFFVIGRRVAEAPALIERMVREGHAVGLHGMDHHRAYAFLSPQAVQDDLVQCARAVTAAGAPRPLWFRPPIGQASPRTFAGARRAGVEIVAWSFRGRDGWRSTKAEQLLARLERALVPGAIVLLHDAWERPTSGDEAPPLGARLLPQILDLCARKGLTPVTLDELVQASTAGRSKTKRAPEA
jgi:peptidoglycan/xylan/chitin deacetylase (PgdA/CDA1 family)